ncbi:MAG: helix-turn-helix transcriptional regulator [Treponema sp.]|nr:helix-turn-helix transcriptional regulator [Treponema sp.]
MTQKELAKLLSIRQPTISDWKKNGVIPPADIVLNIANIFGTSVEFLVTGKEQSIVLSESEARLVRIWRGLSDGDREKIMMLIDFKSRAPREIALQADTV